MFNSLKMIEQLTIENLKKVLDCKMILDTLLETNISPPKVLGKINHLFRFGGSHVILSWRLLFLVNQTNQHLFESNPARVGWWFHASCFFPPSGRHRAAYKSACVLVLDIREAILWRMFT